MILKEKLLLIVLAAHGAIVICDGVAVVQASEDTAKALKVYWNVPTIQCASRGVPFDDLYEKFGIIQNTGDLFDRGDSISILYDPGYFPAIINDSTTGEFTYRNGGVPTEGNLTEHLIKLQEKIEDYIPDANFDGIAILDQESWRPIYRWHWGALAHYKDIIIDLEEENNSTCTQDAESTCCADDQCIQDKAKTHFEAAAREFMQTSLNLAKTLRPKAQWGYYAYPFCFNREVDECDDSTMAENEQLEWLWENSTALYPSVYPMTSLSSYLEVFISGGINEAARLRDLYNPDIPILPYWRYRYRDGGYFTEVELILMMDTFYYSEASGFVIWGASADISTFDQCDELRQYVIDTLGPIIAEYIKPGSTIEVSEDTTTITTITEESQSVTTFTITDASTATDASTITDASTVTDTPIVTDASTTTVAAAITDTSTTRDAATITDAATIADASTVTGASTVTDASTTTVAATITDASTVTDLSTTAVAATVTDVSTVTDATTIIDASNTTDAPTTTLNDTSVEGTSVIETIIKETCVKEVKVIKTTVKDTCDRSDSVKETNINETSTIESSVKETSVKETCHERSSCSNETIVSESYIKNYPSIKTTNIKLYTNETCDQETAE